MISSVHKQAYIIIRLILWEKHETNGCVVMSMCGRTLGVNPCKANLNARVYELWLVLEVQGAIGRPALQLQHDDLIRPDSQQRGGQVERSLWPERLPVPAEVVPVYPHVSFGPALHAHVGVCFRLVVGQLQKPAMKDGAIAMLGTHSRPLQVR